MNKEGKRRGCQFSIGWQRRASLRRYHERSKKVEFLLRTVTRLVKGPPRDTQPPKKQLPFIEHSLCAGYCAKSYTCNLTKTKCGRDCYPHFKMETQAGSELGSSCPVKGDSSSSAPVHYCLKANSSASSYCRCIIYQNLLFF